jgi:cell pole-organizing protein PopZ
MTQAAKAQEPSMEEILASIRRIIADDDENKNAATPDRAPKAAAAAPGPAPVPPAAPVTPVPALDSEPASEAVADESEILDLTEPMSPRADAAVFRTIEAAQDLVFDEAKGEPEKEPEPESASASVASAEEPETELGPRDTGAATAAAARRQFERDSEDERSLLSTTTTAAVDSAFNVLAQTVLVQNSRTLDDLVREMLRPMLKAWLDDNLPNLVERLVRAEIDRVSRGRG